MVKYVIENLAKFSFDKQLFVKELGKSRRWLTIDEWEILLEWVREYHGDKIFGVDLSYTTTQEARID